MSGPAWRVGADIGGTFTDIIALAEDGALLRVKTPSTVDDYSRGIVEGLRGAMSAAALGATAGVVHGTTVATNAILEEESRSLALITTRGFRDVLELRRSRRPTLYDLRWTPPPVLVDRGLRLEVDERVAIGGETVRPLREEDVAACIEQIRGAGVEAVAICLLNSFADATHEERVAELVAAALPEVKLTRSSAVSPEPREFERASTTVVNAFLLPVVDDYLSTLERSLVEIGIEAPLRIMQSDGTTAMGGPIRRSPFRIIESGPAAGVTAAARLAAEIGREAVVTFDMGGTTAKASLVEDGRANLAQELEVGDSVNRGGGLIRGAGYVVRSPCIDITEIGSGGGSIAWIDDGGALRVGPRSAGSDPGPACYGKGGEEATVTDAHVVLGYLNPDGIAGGTKSIDPELAAAAIGRLGERLEMAPEAVAHGIVSIATATMRRAVRAVSVERGRDPRAHSLMSFGGAGGLHAAALARGMEMPEVIVPIVAGLFSSFGLLFADLAATRIAPHRARLGPAAAAAIGERARALGAEAAAELRRLHGAEAEGVDVWLSLRYVGQASTLTLPWRDAEADPVAAAVAAFHAEHRRVYGQAAEEEPVEMTLIRATAVRRPPRLTFAEVAERHLADAARRPPSSRRIYLDPERGYEETPAIGRAALLDGPREGPLAIDEDETTILVPPGFTASLDPSGSILLRASEAA